MRGWWIVPMVLVLGCGGGGGTDDGGPTRDDAAVDDGGPMHDGAFDDAASDGGGVGSDAGGHPCTATAGCGPDSFCDTGSACGEEGFCRWRPSGCPRVWEPVCGCDGVTYSNDCEAARAGASVRADGACESAPVCEADAPCLGRCEGESCDDTWTCRTEGIACTDDIAPYCGCDGVSFGASSTCPDRPWAHRGACEDGASCDTRSVVCLALPPDCEEGWVPEVESTCWSGRCVPIESCRCASADECPQPERFTCIVSDQRCSYYL